VAKKCQSFICLRVFAAVILPKNSFVNSQSKKSKKNTSASTSLESFIKKNEAKTSALKKLLKLFEEEQQKPMTKKNPN
jgi:hypothetical protein